MEFSGLAAPPCTGTTAASREIIKFTDVSAASGLQVRKPATGQPAAKTLAVAPIDLNEDGWMDLVVANDTVQNFVFTNRHNGTFAEVGELSGLAFDSFGQARGAMGIDAARFRNDQAVAVAIGNFANEMNALYVARPAGRGAQLLFTDEAVAEGLGPASQALLKFGLFFFDYDLDGRLDVLTANGHIEDEIEKAPAGHALPPAGAALLERRRRAGLHRGGPRARRVGPVPAGRRSRQRVRGHRRRR